VKKAIKIHKVCEIRVRSDINYKLIDGLKIPPIGSKNVKIGDFVCNSRKTFLYLPLNELYSAYNGKISAYFGSFDQHPTKKRSVFWERFHFFLLCKFSFT